MSATATDLLSDLTRLGVHLESKGDGKLGIRAPKGVMTDELKATLTERKAEILAALAKNANTIPAGDVELLARCREACGGLSLWAGELLAALSEDDKRAISGNDPAELKALRTMAEGLAARLRTGRLPAGLNDAYERLRRELNERPEIPTASEVLTPDDDPVLVALAIRGKGCITMRITRAKFDSAKLLEILDRTN